MDLAAAIAAAGQSGGTAMRVGTVTGFNAGNGALTVSVAGTAMPNLNYAPSYLPLVGDTVAVLNSGPVWFVLGSTTSTLANTLPRGQVVGNSTESTTSGTFTDLATFGPQVTVTVGASGRAVATVSSLVTVLPGGGPTMGVALSGANTAAADAGKALVAGINSPASGTFQMSRSILFTGLTQGATTFTAKYLASGGAVSAGFLGRELLVQAF